MAITDQEIEEMQLKEDENRRKLEQMTLAWDVVRKERSPSAPPDIDQVLDELRKVYNHIGETMNG